MNSRTLLSALVIAVTACAPRPADGIHTLKLYTTNDVHGRYFDSLYVGTNTNTSLLAVNEYMNGVREANGGNVIFIDAGDCLQGDNAAYYYNYVDTKTKHLYARMAEYMKYDAVVVGNHDIETGHPVYDRLRKTMKVPFLAANAVSEKTGKPYFKDYVMLCKDGFKVAVIGCTNANIKGWLSGTLWSGMDFVPLVECVQNKVDEVVRKEKPDVVIVAVHSGTGPGDGSELESEGRDLLYSLNGVDFLVCSHDHRPYTEIHGGCALINSGSHCRNLGYGEITLEVRDGKVVSKTLDADLITIDKDRTDEAMRVAFAKDYEAVKAFTTQPVGSLAMDLRTRDGYRGQSDCMNLVHTLSLTPEEAVISFAAPLMYNGFVPKGEIIYNDLFTIYPFENQLFVLTMSGREIKDYLEYSYSQWVRTISSPEDHVLNIVEEPDSRTGMLRWTFAERSYNFDSAAGINYIVDVTKPYGDRVTIMSMADGSDFSMDGNYGVAMTSYRASGGGGLLKAAGIEDPESRVIGRYSEIREILYNYLKSCPEVTPESVAEGLGSWNFVPADLAAPAFARDMHLLFPRYE